MCNAAAYWYNQIMTNKTVSVYKPGNFYNIKPTIKPSKLQSFYKAGNFYLVWRENPYLFRQVQAG